jgi:hypothetical protein
MLPRPVGAVKHDDASSAGPWEPSESWEAESRFVTRVLNHVLDFRLLPNSLIEFTMATGIHMPTYQGVFSSHRVGRA